MREEWHLAITVVLAVVVVVYLVYSVLSRGVLLALVAVTAGVLSERRWRSGRTRDARVVEKVQMRDVAVNTDDVEKTEEYAMMKARFREEPHAVRELIRDFLALMDRHSIVENRRAGLFSDLASGHESHGRWRRWADEYGSVSWDRFDTEVRAWYPLTMDPDDMERRIAAIDRQLQAEQISFGNMPWQHLLFEPDEELAPHFNGNGRNLRAFLNAYVTMMVGAEIPVEHWKRQIVRYMDPRCARDWRRLHVMNDSTTWYPFIRTAIETLHPRVFTLLWTEVWYVPPRRITPHFPWRAGESPPPEARPSRIQSVSPPPPYPPVYHAEAAQAAVIDPMAGSSRSTTPSGSDAQPPPSPRQRRSRPRGRGRRRRTSPSAQYGQDAEIHPVYMFEDMTDVGVPWNEDHIRRQRFEELAAAFLLDVQGGTGSDDGAEQNVPDGYGYRAEVPRGPHSEDEGSNRLPGHEDDVLPRQVFETWAPSNATQQALQRFFVRLPGEEDTKTDNESDSDRPFTDMDTATDSSEDDEAEKTEQVRYFRTEHGSGVQREQAGTEAREPRKVAWVEETDDSETWGTQVFGHDASAYDQTLDPEPDSEPTYYTFVLEENPDDQAGFDILALWTCDETVHPNRSLSKHIPADEPWPAYWTADGDEAFATVPSGDGPRGASGLGKRPYKSALLKVKPLNAQMPEEYRIVRRRPSDPMLSLPKISHQPPDFVPTLYMTEERMSWFGMDQADHLWPSERKLFKHILALNEVAFTWTERERRRFRSDYFPPIKLAVTEHTPWCRRHVPIPPAIRDKVIELFKEKIAAGVYEECTSAYRNSWFCVVKKDGNSLRIVHDLQPLNEHVIRDAGLVPQPDEFSEECAGRTLLSTLDLYSSFDLQLIDPAYRDLTAFQTPLGVLRNVGLPMGYTNSVPIQQANVSFILQPEIPDSANVFVDDVIVKGTRSYLTDQSGEHKTIPGNTGIREFVWVHANNLNRVLHRIGCAGGSVSGKKAVIAGESAVVVGYRCSIQGRFPEQGNVDKILNWPHPKTVTEVCGFLGTAAVSKLWIYDFARIARPLYDLTKKGVDFIWTDDCTNAMERLQDLVVNAPGLRPIDYSSTNNVILAVDSSVIGVGYILSQIGDDNKRYPSRFGSITWNEVETRYSQAKLELHGLFRSLRAVRLHIYGVKSLVVEVDAKYIKGMLNNPDMQPNATINHWIAGVLLFNPRIVHVPATKHQGADGLSRRPFVEGDVDELDDADDWLDHQLGIFAEEASGPIPAVVDSCYSYVDFGLVLTDLGLRSADCPEDLVLATGTQPAKVPRGDRRSTRANPASSRQERAEERNRVRERQVQQQRQRQPRATETVIEEAVVKPQADPFISDDEPEATQDGSEQDDDEPGPGVQPEYPADRRRPATRVTLEEYQQVVEDGAEIPRGRKGRKRDAELPVLKRFLETGLHDRAMTAGRVKDLVKKASRFFVWEDKLYRREDSGEHRRVLLDNDERLAAMNRVHDELGHKGFRPVRAALHTRFWWSDMDTDIRWYTQSCHHCQVRKTDKPRVPQAVPVVPSLFVKVHVDVMQMAVASGGKTALVQARCALSSYVEWRALGKVDAAVIARFLYEDVLCRWGCIQEIVTDNGPEVQGAVEELLEKYRIEHIKVSAYNKRANGLVERKHFDVRESLMKACRRRPSQWLTVAPLVFWAERVTIKAHLGMSPFQMAHGVPPVLPLDLADATWLAPPLSRTLSEEDLIAYRVRQLEKRPEDISELRGKVTKYREAAAKKMELNYKGLKTPHPLPPGTLVLVRNSKIEMEHSRKPKPRWLGPFVVVRRHDKGSYIVAELSSAVLVDRIAAERVRLYYPRVGHAIDISEIVSNTPAWVWEKANGEQARVDEQQWADAEARAALDEEDDDDDWL